MVDINKYIKYKHLSIGIIIIIVVLFLVIMAVNFLNTLSIPTSKQSMFKGDAEFFNFTGQNSGVQFKAQGIYFIANETMFYSLKNITVESNDGKMRLINYSNSLQIQYNDESIQYLPNVDLDIYFKNLTLAKELGYISINLYGINTYNKIESTGGKVYLQKDSVNYVFIGNEKLTEFRSISFEMDNTSSVLFLSDIIKLRAYRTSDLKIMGQLSKIFLYQGEGEFGLNNHIFDVTSTDIFNVEMSPNYQEQSFLTVDDTKIIFTGVPNLAELNNENLIMNDFYYWLKIQPEKINAYSSAINAAVAVFLLILTILNVLSAQRLVSMEAEKKKHEKEKFLNILLAEFVTNSGLLEDLRKSIDDIIKYPSKLITEFAFLGFKDDGFNTFRNQGGFQYVSLELYNKIINHYNLLYRIIKKLDVDYLT